MALDEATQALLEHCQANFRLYAIIEGLSHLTGVGGGAKALAICEVLSKIPSNILDELDLLVLGQTQTIRDRYLSILSLSGRNSPETYADALMSSLLTSQATLAKSS